MAVNKNGGSGDKTNLSVPLSMSAALCAWTGYPNNAPVSSSSEASARLKEWIIVVVMGNPLFSTLNAER